MTRCVIQIRCTPEEKAAWVAKATECNLSLSEWMRRRTNLGDTDLNAIPVADLAGKYVNDRALRSARSDRKPNGHTLNCKCWTCCPPT